MAGLLNNPVRGAQPCAAAHPLCQRLPAANQQLRRSAAHGGLDQRPQPVAVPRRGCGCTHGRCGRLRTQAVADTAAATQATAAAAAPAAAAPLPPSPAAPAAAAPTPPADTAAPAAAAAQQAPVEPPVEFERDPMYSSPPTPVSDLGFSRSFYDKYEMGEKIGKGASCTVHMAVHTKTGESVAVKVMPKQFATDGFLDRHFVRRVRNEVDIGSRLGRSLNVCYFHGAYESEAAVHLVMEQCSGGQLWDRVLKGEYTERQAARLMREVLRTVAQCHAKCVMMRDIKPQNFMFAGPEESAPLKAVDFGISVFCQPGEYITQRAGTRIIMAPEVVRQRYTLSADLWSSGIMAYLLLTGRLPYPFWEKLYINKQPLTSKDMFGDICYAPLDFESPPWDTLSADARDFVQSLLQRDETLRPTAEEALQHRWLQQGQAQGSSRDVPLNESIVQRLQRFGTYGRLKQVALRRVASILPQDNMFVSDLRGVFLELDIQDAGMVPYTRLQQELEEGRFDLSPAESQQLLAQMDITPSGHITFNEFLAALMDWGKLKESSQWDSLVERAFESMDTERCGRIRPKDLELVLCGEEGCEAADILDAAMREADIDHDGAINLPEFRRLLAGQLQDPLDLFESRLQAAYTYPGGSLDSQAVESLELQAAPAAEVMGA